MFVFAKTLNPNLNGSRIWLNQTSNIMFGSGSNIVRKVRNRTTASLSLRVHETGPWSVRHIISKMEASETPDYSGRRQWWYTRWVDMLPPSTNHCRNDQGHLQNLHRKRVGTWNYPKHWTWARTSEAVDELVDTNLPLHVAAACRKFEFHKGMLESLLGYLQRNADQVPSNWAWQISDQIRIIIITYTAAPCFEHIMLFYY